MHTTAPQAMRVELLGMVDGLSAYHLLRGATVEKVGDTPDARPNPHPRLAPRRI